MTVKKFTALFTCLCLSLSLLFTCSGCNSKDKDTLTGTWESAVDMTEMLNASLASDPETSELNDYLKIDSYVLNLVFTFNSDGTYKIAIDRDALAETSASLLENLKDGMVRYFEDTLKDAGLEMTVEEALEASNVNLDDMFDMDEILSAFDAVESEGTYEVKDGKLYLTDKATNTVDIETYEMVSDTEMRLINDSENAEDELSDITLIKK